MKVLEITSELDGGGVERLLYDYCSRMISEIQFDFIVTSKVEGILEKPLKDLGCNIFHIPQIRGDYKAHCATLEDIIKNGRYDIVHDHSGFKAWCNLRIAKKCGVKVRIAHSHQSFMSETLKQRIERLLSTPITKRYANHLFACGVDAAKWMWGKKKFEHGDIYIMKNAIDTKRFTFSEEKRENIRNKMNLQNKFVIGNVARFSYQKNHEFLIRIFSEVKKNKENAVLMLIGRGELEEDIRKQVKELNLLDSVIFMGVRDDVYDLLNVMDLFLLTSRYEGLPVTLVEVQANGLASIVSDKVTKEIHLLENMKYLSIDLPPQEWSNEILNYNCERIHEENDYDISKCVEDLKKEYICYVTK